MSDPEKPNANLTPEQRGLVGRVIYRVLTNKLVVAVGLVFVILFGLASAPFDWDLGGIERDRVPVDAIPNLGANQQIVYAEWPGHSPRDVDDQVTLPLTTSLLNLKGVRTVRSSSMYGLSSVYVIFQDDTDFYESRTRILEQLASLPADALPAGVEPALGPDATALGQIYWYTLQGRDPDGNPVGGWGLEELRTIQDYYVRYALSAAEGVAEVASIGGFVRQFHVDLDREAMRQFDVGLDEVYRAIRSSNLDVSARTLEINGVEYFARGIGFVRTVEDLEQVVVKPAEPAPILLGQLAKISLGQARRRGALDRNGVEAVGGVVVARQGANPLEVIQNVKTEIARLAPALDRKALLDTGRVSAEQLRAYAGAHGFAAFVEGQLNDEAWLGHLEQTDPSDWPDWATISQVTIEPFYDRTELIHETLGTLESALSQQVLITIVVVVLMLVHLRSSVLIGSMLPLAVLICFIAMKLFGVEANIVALAGIAIAIGTIVDMGIVLCENIVDHLEQADPNEPRLQVVHRAASEVGSAVLTAVATTVISFLPVFFLGGDAGRLFRPLAFTKTFALLASILLALLVLPPAALLVLRPGRRDGRAARFRRVGRYALNFVTAAVVAAALSWAWLPLGPQTALAWNLVFTFVLIGVLIGLFWLYRMAYPYILSWCLRHKLLFLSVPVSLLVAAVAIWQSMGREFRPSLDEGSFLWMPTISAHGGIGEALDAVQRQDRAILSVPEVEYVVGKIGRVDSALDPAPLTMIETVVQYKPEYGWDEQGNRVRNWRPEIKTPADIWDEIARAGDLTGSTSAPPLQPIETRLVMLQTGMRAAMGVKVYGEDLEQLQAAAVAIEAALQEVPEIRPDSVSANRVVGKPYMEIDTRDPFTRRQMRLYQIRPAAILDALAGYIGGREVTTSIQGRIRIPVLVQLQREQRDDMEQIRRLPISTPKGIVPLGEIARVESRPGPQMITSEDTFKVAYVIFSGRQGVAELEVVEAAREHLDSLRREDKLRLGPGIRYDFAGQYQQEVRTNRTLAVILPIALGLIFLILYLQFKSVWTTGVVAMGIAVAWSGGFLILWLYGQGWFLDFELFGRSMREVFQAGAINLSTAVWVGFLALFGIATDDGVVMSTYLQQSFRANKTRNVEQIRDATIQAGCRRVRPCLMTTATTVLALLPILTATGRGSDIMLPMALPSFGGMLIEVMTMLTVPVLYCAGIEWKRRLFGGGRD
jgi:Cu(I)/Ag(I) efflux system membrane protein CusA/SilA